MAPVVCTSSRSRAVRGAASAPISAAGRRYRIGSGAANLGRRVGARCGGRIGSPLSAARRAAISSAGSKPRRRESGGSRGTATRAPQSNPWGARRRSGQQSGPPPRAGDGISAPRQAHARPRRPTRLPSSSQGLRIAAARRGWKGLEGGHTGRSSGSRNRAHPADTQGSGEGRAAKGDPCRGPGRQLGRIGVTRTRASREGRSPRRRGRGTSGGWDLSAYAGQMHPGAGSAKPGLPCRLIQPAAVAGRC